MIDLDDVRAAVALSDFDALAAQRQMVPQPRALRRSWDRPGTARQASVMILLFPSEAGLAFALLRRTENPHDVHSGQISLPGGSQESGETVIETAIRETREELGVTAAVQVIGSLASLYIPPSDFEVHPVVACLESHPVWRPDPVEVAEVVECPLEWLLDDNRKRIEDWEMGGYTLRVPWYDVFGHRVWGATAIILSELEHRLRQISKGRDATCT